MDRYLLIHFIYKEKEVSYILQKFLRWKVNLLLNKYLQNPIYQPYNPVKQRLRHLDFLDLFSIIKIIFIFTIPTDQPILILPSAHRTINLIAFR